jgi:hypothetical protein
MSQAGRDLWNLSFRYSPVLLTGGIAQNVPGQILPILALTDAAALAQGLITSTYNFFASWEVLPGSTLISQKIGTYPFVNQVVAANATIQNPNTVSMMMICPAQPGNGLTGALVGGLVAGGIAALGSSQGSVGVGSDGVPEVTITSPGQSALVTGLGGAAVSGFGGYVAKLATITALQSSIAQHNALGGTYTVLTAGYIFSNCILTLITDISSGETRQPQVRWRWDFTQPQVLSLQQAQTAFNNTANRISQGLPLPGNSNLGVTGAASLAGGATSSALQSLYSGAKGVLGIPQ